MTIQVAPTLALMAEIYRLPRDGGAKSPRFVAYTSAAARLAPIAGYNPMTSKDVTSAIDALMAINAEERLAAVANATAARLQFADAVTMHLIVAAPGLWTDRLLTEVHHHLVSPDQRGVLLWFDDVVSAETLDAACAAQATRLVEVARHGVPATLRAAVRQEGRALAAAGVEGARDDAAAEVLEVLGDDHSLATMVAFLYGDETAVALGYAALGIGAGVGAAHAVARATSPASHR